MSRYKEKLKVILDFADVKINGSRPFDVHIHNPATYKRVITEGSIGAGESYMDGWWDCEQADEMFYRLLKARVDEKLLTFKDKLIFALGGLINKQSIKRALRVGEQHYDVGNDLYQLMLDKRMIYSCGYWREATNLDQAQEHKLELVARKLKLEPGMRVLDIGCGWGGSARYMAERHGVHVTGITISKAQYTYALENSKGLDVEFLLQDYREIQSKYDRIYSIGMFEHVGFRNYSKYFEVVRNCLADQGLFLLHTIGHGENVVEYDPWTIKYIFPNSSLPAASEICSSKGNWLNLEDWQSFGLYYYPTLMAWYENIKNNWQNLPAYDERFQRMWRYYLMTNAGLFKSYNGKVWQIVFSKGIPAKPYQPVCKVS